MAKEYGLSTSKLPRGGLRRNSVERITDHHDMTSAVHRERKALTKPTIFKSDGIILESNTSIQDIAETSP